MANYDGLTRNAWPGTWSTNGVHPIALDVELRGGLRLVSGSGTDTLVNIPSGMLQNGMLAYVASGYHASISGDTYYKYSILEGESRDTNTGFLPNNSGNWSILTFAGGGAGDAIAVSGWADSTMDTRDASVSGWASSTISAGDTAVSGWAEAYINSQDHSAVAVSGWADSTFTLSGVTSRGSTTPDAITINNNLTAETVFADLDGPTVLTCKNTTGSGISAGTPVYVSGYFSNNGKALIAPAAANDPSKMPAIGILASALSDDEEGHVHIFGLSAGLNTSSFNVGQTVYVSPSGGLTNSRPSGLNELVQNIGRVLRSDASQGRVLVLGPGRTNDTPNSGNFEQLTVNGYTLPTSDGSEGQVISTDGLGNLVFSTITKTSRVYNNVSEDFSMTDSSDVVFVDTTLGSVNIYLPTANGKGGKEVLVKLKSGSNSGVLVASGSQTIDGQSVLPIYSLYQSVTLISDNSNWFIS